LACDAVRSAVLKVTSHTKMRPKPMISSVARVMRPSTKTMTAGTSTTAMQAEMRRSRRGVHGLASMMTRMPRNDSIVPDAPRSCSGVLTLSGTSPTRARCAPNEAMSTTRARARWVWACTASSRRCRIIASSWRTRAAKTMSRPPADIEPMLNDMPEKSR